MKGWAWLAAIGRIFSRKKGVRATRATAGHADANLRAADPPAHSAVRGRKKTGKIRQALALAWRRLSLKAKVFTGLALLAVFIFVLGLFRFTRHAATYQ